MVSEVRKTLTLVPVVLREVLLETRDLAHLLWIEHDSPEGSDPVLQDAPKETRETWWQVAAAALKMMRQDPEVSPDQTEPSVDELARLMRIRYARALDSDAVVPDPGPEDVDEWERLAAVALAWWATQTSTPEPDEPA